MAPFPLTFPSVSYGQVAVAVGTLYALYLVGLGIYRLFFHPLRHVPGPKLAALTQWVETYYECFKPPGGQFMWAYQKWHEKYGPIVRISPDEVHIQDPTFYETLYAQSRHSDKLKRLEHRFNNSMSSFATAEHHLHRVRRAALNPFFSKRRIAQWSPHIQRHMDRLADRVRAEYAGTDNILNMNNMWGAFTSDIVVSYCLEKPYDFIMKPDFRADFSDAMVDLLDPVHFITQFPWMIKSLQKLPEWLIKLISPPMRSVIAFNNEMKEQILRAKAVHENKQQQQPPEKEKQNRQDAAQQPQHQSLFTALLESDLPAEELSTTRLQHEAISVIGAGIETTMYTLAACSYHLLANPAQLARLRAELEAAIPDPARMPDLDALMQLPYLTCVVNEALRFGYGTPQRIPRLSPTPMVYRPREGLSPGLNQGRGAGKDATCYELPVGVVVSMDHYSTSHDPWLFPGPHEFRPERWEGDPRAPDGKPLTRYLIAFGRGTRSCVGMQLAYADLYIALATFFRRFECELFETGRDAVDCYLDSFVPRPKPGTKGVRVRVLRAV